MVHKELISQENCYKKPSNPRILLLICRQPLNFCTSNISIHLIRTMKQSWTYPNSTFTILLITITLIVTLVALPIMSRSVTGFTSLCLYCRETVTFPSNRPSIQTLICWIGELGYTVGVYPFPNKDIKSIPSKDWHYAVKIKDTLLVIIPLSLSESSGEESK